MPRRVASERMRVLVIGARVRGLAHLSVLTRLHDLFEVAGVCEADPSLVTAAAAQFQLPAFTELERALDATQPQMAVISVTPDLNHWIVAYLAQRGVHALVETPVGPTTGTTDLLIESAAAGGILVAVGENSFRRPLERLRARILASGQLGEVTRVWNFRRYRGSHAMCLLRRYAELPPRELAGYQAAFPLTHEVGGRRHEDWEHARIIFGDTVLGYTEHLTPASPMRATGFLRVECTGGTIEEREVLTPEGRSQVATKFNRRRVLSHVELGEVNWHNPFTKYAFSDEDEISIADELCNLRQAILTRGTPEYNAASAREDVELMCALEESARAQMTMLLPLGTLTAHEAQLHFQLERKWGRHPLDLAIAEPPNHNWH